MEVAMDHAQVNPVRTHGKGRVCRDPGCGTKLSIYNPKDFCSLHTKPQTIQVRGVKG